MEEVLVVEEMAKIKMKYEKDFEVEETKGGRWRCGPPDAPGQKGEQGVKATSLA